MTHADLLQLKRCFLAIPPEDEARLLDAARFMDANECETIIPAARDTAGKSRAEIQAAIDEAVRRFGDRVRERFGRKGEW